MNAIIEQCTDPRRRAVLTPEKLRAALDLPSDAEMKIEAHTDGKGGFDVVVTYTAPTSIAAPAAVEIPKPKRTTPKPPAVVVEPSAADDTL